MDAKIYEYKNEQHTNAKGVSYLMTDEQKKRGQYYIDEYRMRQGEIQKNQYEWDSIWKLYSCERDPYNGDPNYPNSFIPLITPVVEGQVASMIESGVEFTHVSDNPAHQPHMLKYDAASEYYRRKNMFMPHFKDFSRKYDLLGNAWITVSWEKSLEKVKGKPNGFPRLCVPPINSILVDGRIKDYKDIQYAEYIIQEIGFVPIGWARKEYSDEKADALCAGTSTYDGDNPDVSYDDSNSFMLLHVWTRNNKQENLQLIEMDDNGFILRESDSSKPYYKKVGNEYPFAFARMIPIEGRFFGYGDGKILKPMQEVVNKLTDELELAARFSAQTKIIVDPKARMDVDQLDSDPSTYAVAENPNQNIMQLQSRGLDNVVVTMIEFLLREAQRATRFSDVMTGQAQAASSTATAVNSALIQGSVGIRDKKSDIAAVMEWADKYCLKLCLEKWDKPFWSNLANDYYEYLDMQSIGQAPMAMPLSDKTIEKMLEDGDIANNKPIPAWETVRGTDGKNVMLDIDFDTKVVMGAGIPKGRTDMYNILLGLMQIQTVDENGQPKPFITMKRARTLMEQTLGFKLSDPEALQMSQNTQMLGTNPMMAGINPVGQNGNVQMPTQAQSQPSPDNLFGTVPQMPNGDSRRVQI